MTKISLAVCLLSVAFVSFSFAKPAEEPAAKQAVASDPLSDNLAKIKNKDASVRRQAAEALGGIRNSSAIEPLKELLKDENTFVRIAALDSLGLLRANSAVREIAGVLAGDAQDSARQSAAVALGYIGDRSSVSDLIKALKDKHDGTRFAAANALGSIRDSAALSALIEGLKDANVGMRRSCLNAIGRIEDASSLPAIREAMNDTDVTVRSEAIRLGGVFMDKQSIESFKNLLKDENRSVNIAAAGALAKMGVKDGLSVALKAIKEVDPILKMRSAEILGLIGGGQTSRRDGLLQASGKPAKDRKIRSKARSKTFGKKIKNRKETGNA